MTGLPPAAVAVIRAALDTAPPRADSAVRAEWVARELEAAGWWLVTDEPPEPPRGRRSRRKGGRGPEGDPAP